MKIKFIAQCVLASTLLLFAACNKKTENAEGPMESAGEEIDETAQETGEGVEEAAEETGEAIEEAGDDVEDAVE